MTESDTNSGEENSKETDQEGEKLFPDEILFGGAAGLEGGLPDFYVEEDDEKSVQLSEGERGRIAEKLESLPVLSPREIEESLVKRGYRGQEFARRAGATLAYRHMQRLRREFIDKVPEEDFSLRENYLFLGATGSGKTFLTEMLFRDILGVPTVVADVTRYSETGYIGDDVLMLLSELFEAAGQDRAWASCGIICLDEFDKLAASRSAARFAGEGTTKDVSGFGVQRGLLNLLSGRSSPFPTDFGYSAFGQKLTMPLHNIMFIACGAFSGLQQVADLAEGGGSASIGFLQDNRKNQDESLVAKIGFELMEDTRAFANYGILPELVGRFSRMVPFQPLSAEVLREILEENVLRSYRREFEAEQVNLVVEDEVIDLIVDSARRRETGARAVRASLVPHLEEAAFRAFGDGGGATVRLFVNKGQIELEVTLLA
ncbi:MAG: AAA family ATPase [Verrucomicrobiales bacterium]|nr:AAA family ATPase [Verrucomicrobiales bacterium]